MFMNNVWQKSQDFLKIDVHEFQSRTTLKHTGVMTVLAIKVDNKQIKVKAGECADDDILKHL
jgi:hypothetical protein